MREFISKSRFTVVLVLLPVEVLAVINVAYLLKYNLEVKLAERTLMLAAVCFIQALGDASELCLCFCVLLMDLSLCCAVFHCRDQLFSTGKFSQSQFPS